MPETGWQRRFDEPIPLSRGRQLVTLKDAADYVMKLPKAEHERWQTAIQCLIMAAEDPPNPDGHQLEAVASIDAHQGGFDVLVVQQFNQPVDGGDCVTRAGAIYSLCCYEMGWESRVSK